MTGKLGALLANGGRSIAVTVGSSGDQYGFLVSTFGTVAPTAVADNSGVSRTINAIYWDDSDDLLVFQLAGTLANTNATFYGIIVNGVLYTRAAGTASIGVNSTWTWALASNPLAANRVVMVL